MPGSQHEVTYLEHYQGRSLAFSSSIVASRPFLILDALPADVFAALQPDMLYQTRHPVVDVHFPHREKVRRLHSMIIRHEQVLLSQAMQSAACGCAIAPNLISSL
jgi:hypothetical protein